MESMDTENTTIGVIAERFKLSKSHLMKVINKLVTHGYVHSTRGKHGGIRLAKPANTISLKEIVILMEKTLTPFDCAGQKCLILNVCVLKDAFGEAQKQYLDHLDNYTVADMINQNVKKTIHFNVK